MHYIANAGSEELAVVCRQLGPYTYWTGASYSQGCGSVFIDDLDCSGDEDRLEYCFHRSVCSTNCDHNQDVAVYCYCKLPIAAFPLLLHGSIFTSEYPTSGSEH